MIATITLIGHIGHVENRVTQSGLPVLNLSVSHTYGEKTDDGWENFTTWYECSMWGGANSEEYFSKFASGDLVYILGELKIKEWETKTGEKRIQPQVTISKIKILKHKEIECPTKMSEKELADEIPF